MEVELPSLRQILTRLLKDLEGSGANLKDSLSTTTETNVTLTIESQPDPVQKSLLALHSIYPNLLLSSLDLLDNGLVTRYVSAPDGTDQPFSSPSIYYVRSSQTRPSRFAATSARSVYEVRPLAWHCTCPSFAFSAFSLRTSFDPFERGEDDCTGSERWGGEMRGGQAAICKHLLAVLVGERLQVILEKQVDMYTLANYAFGDA
jgi:hypothetical protein